MSNDFVIDKKRTDYLKGWLIIAVLINHYLNFYILGNISHFSNRLIAIFFILSGVGIFFSLEKRFNNKKITLATIGSFYFHRFLRIYPLYILALFFLYGNSISLVSIFAINAPGIFWFVCAIIHCYILAPLFYFLYKKIKTNNYIISTILLFLVLNGVLFFFFNNNFIQTALARPFGFIGLFLTHIFLFALGLSIPGLQKKLKHKKLFLFFTSILFFTLMILTEINLGASINIFLSLLLVAFSFLFILHFVGSNSRLPTKKLFSFLGKYVYSIYLFHVFYFSLLFNIGIIKKDSLTSLLLTIIISPLFFLFCFAIEKSYNKVVGLLKI